MSAWSLLWSHFFVLPPSKKIFCITIWHVSKERGGITNGEMKKEKGADTPFCTIGKPEISIKNKSNNTNMLDW